MHETGTNWVRADFDGNFSRLRVWFRKIARGFHFLGRFFLSRTYRCRNANSFLRDIRILSSVVNQTRVLQSWWKCDSAFFLWRWIHFIKAIESNSTLLDSISYTKDSERKRVLNQIKSTNNKHKKNCFNVRSHFLQI